MFRDNAPPRSKMFTSPNVRCAFCNTRLSVPPSGKHWLTGEWGVMSRKVCRVCPGTEEDNLEAEI